MRAPDEWVQICVHVSPIKGFIYKFVLVDSRTNQREILLTPSDGPKSNHVQ